MSTLWTKTNECENMKSNGSLRDCFLESPEFYYKVSVTLQYQDYYRRDDSLIVETDVDVYPNKKNTTEFTINVPTDISYMRIDDGYKTLKLKFETLWANSTKMTEKRGSWEHSSTISSKEVDLIYIDKEHILVQSDKAKYKPGNTVLFRVLTVDQHLHGLEATVGYEIKSPSGNIMDQNKNIISSYGVIEGRFKLDAYAEKGLWRIKVTSRYKKEREQRNTNELHLPVKTYNFEVEEYTLPKFEVNIKNGDNFLIENDGKGYSARVEAKYTFGKSVLGKLNLTLTNMPCEQDDEDSSSSMSGGGPPCKQGSMEILIEKTFKGKEDIQIKSDELAKAIDKLHDRSSHCNCGKRLKMEATVTDKYTGEVQTAQTMIKIEKSRYTIKWLYEPPAPRPEPVGMTYIGQVTMIDGSELDTDGEVTVKIHYTEIRTIDKSINGLIYKYNKYIITTKTITQNVTLGDGIFNIKIDKNDKDYFRIQAVFKPTGWIRPTKGPDRNKADIYSYYRYSRYINKDKQLSITANVSGKLIPNTESIVTINSTYDAKPIFYALAKGEVVFSQSVNVQQNNSTQLKAVFLIIM